MPRIIRYDRPAAVPPLEAVHLEITRGRVLNRLRPVNVRAFLIGTAPDCDLVLGDGRFPEVHAYLMRSGRGVTIRWLGAGPPLAVNGRTAVDSERLASGDLIRTGPFEFRVWIGEIPAGATSPGNKSTATLVRRAAARRLTEG